jgi:hypothetical protein
MDAKTSATLDRLVQSLDKLQNYMARNYNSGRGGVGTSERRSTTYFKDSDKLRSAEIQKTREIIDSTTAFKMLKEAIKGSSRMAEIFTGEVRRIYTEADKVLEEYEDTHKDFIESTRKYLQTQGLNNKVLYESSKNFNILANTAKSLTDAFDEYSTQQELVQSLKEQETKLREKRAATKDSDEQKELDKQIKALSKKLKAATEAEEDALQKYQQIYNSRPVQNLGEVFKTIDKSHPIWLQMNEGLKEWIETGTTQKITYQQLNTELHKLIENTKIYDETLVAVGKGMEESLENFQNSLVNSIRNLKAAIAAGGAIFGSKVIDGVLAQFRYGIIQSNFTEALLSGISDPKMSQILGDYQTELRNLAGSANLVDASDDFRKAIEGSARKMGLIGDEAADFTANLIRMKYSIGLGSKNIDSFYDGISAIARSAFMTKEEVIGVMQDLQEANILGTMRTDIKNAKEREEAIQADIAAMLRHGKALGLTTQQTLAFRKELAGKRYSSLEELIKARIGASMAQSALGLNFDMEKVQEAKRKNAMGIASEEEQKLLLDFRTATQRATLNKIEKEGESGLIFRQMLDTVSGGDAGVSSQELLEAKAAKSTQRSAFEGDDAAIKRFMEEGILPLNVKFIEGQKSFADLKKQVEEVDSALGIFESAIPDIVAIYQGLGQNPAFASLVGGGIISAIGGVFQTIVAARILTHLGFPTIRQILFGGAKKLWSGALSVFTSPSMARFGQFLLTFGRNALSLINPIAKLGAAFAAGYAIGTVLYDEILSKSEFFIQILNMLGGAIQSTVGWIQKNVLGLLSDEQKIAGEENIRIGQTQLKEGQAYFIGKAFDAAAAVGLASKEEANAAKEKIYETINKTSEEEYKKRQEEKKALDERIAKAVETTAENTGKVATAEEQKKQERQQKAFETRSIHDMESALSGINTEISNRMKKYTDVNNY